MASLHCTLAFASALLVAGAASASDLGCERSLLQELGWRFVATDAAQPSIEAGTPCERASIADAQANGDLRVAVPHGAEAATVDALHRELLDHPATTCAYAFKLGDATRRAVDQLAANPGYRFSGLQAGWIGFGPGGAARDGWRSIAGFGRGFVPRGGNWDAINAFYSGSVRAECGVGRQVAQFAAQAELYGPQGFDAAFEAEEIAIGTWHVLNRSGGILQGAASGEMTHDGLARKASAQGRQAFMGVPGYIEHVFGRETLDDINNQAENFVVYDVSEDAAAALRTRGGFADYNAMAEDLWRLSQSIQRQGGSGYFERLLIKRDPSLRAQLDPMQRDTLAKLDAIVADPFFSGFRIYVHRHGVTPIAYHYVRLLDRNPRTPFRVGLALHNVHTTLMQRWIEHRLLGCAREPVASGR